MHADDTRGDAPAPGRASRLRTILEAEFAPDFLDIQDDSALHAGHGGAQPGGETHYSVTLVSPRFSGLSRMQRSRAVHEALADELANGLHALSLRLRAPQDVDS